MRFLDSHSHIFSEEFAEDFDEMLKRADDADVKRIVIMCTKVEEAKRAMACAQKDPARFQVAYGIHPEDVKNDSEELWEASLEVFNDPRCLYVGEIGLDYHWEKETKEEQRNLFIRQIEVAKQIGKPIMVHARDASQETLDILKEHQVPGILHCYSGSAEMAVEYTKLGYYISLGGALTFKNARHSVEVVRAIDPKYLLSETDCPYMAPVPKRGTRNEPSYIPYIVEKMAEVRGVSVEEMAAIIWENGQCFLGRTE